MLLLADLHRLKRKAEAQVCREPPVMAPVFLQKSPVSADGATDSRNENFWPYPARTTNLLFKLMSLTDLVGRPVRQRSQEIALG